MIKTVGASIYIAMDLVKDLQKEVLEIQQEGTRISYEDAFAARLLNYTQEELIELDTDIYMLGMTLMSLSKMIVARLER